MAAAGLFSCSFETRKIGRRQKIDTKMAISCVDDFLAYLSSLVTEMPDFPDDLNVQINDVKLQFRFLKMFLCFFPQWWDCDDDEYMFKGEWLNELELMIQECKTELKNYSDHLISCSLLRNLIHFTRPTSNKAARLTILYWLNEEQDEETGEKLQSSHLDLLQRTPELTRLCFEVIKVPKVNRSDTLSFWEFLSRFVDFFLENLVFTLKDDVPMLREGLILLISFLADPPINVMDYYDLSFFQEKIHAVLDQASHTIRFFDETSMDFTRGKTNVVHLQKSIDEVRGKIEKLYLQIPQMSWSNFPKTNGLGHFEFLLVYLENLKEAMNKNKKLVPFLKHQIFTIKEELMLLRPRLQHICKMQNEHEEVKDMWEQITSLSYQSDLAIKSSFFIDQPI